MEGDSEKTKISYFHHWVDSEGMAQIESWKNNKTPISQEEYEKLDENQKEGKYSLDKVESYFTLFESMLAPRSNPCCQRITLCQARFYEFWRVPCTCSENCEKMQISLRKGRRAIRDTIFLGTNSTKAINLMNEEGKEFTVEFLMQVRNRRLQCSSQESIPARFQYFRKFCCI